jgi:hypothetical protein
MNGTDRDSKDKDKDDHKKIMLKCETELERDQWMQAFKTAQANLKNAPAPVMTKRNKLL